MLYCTIPKELPRRRRVTLHTQNTQKLAVPKVLTISLVTPPCSYRLVQKKGMTKVVKLFI